MATLLQPPIDPEQAPTARELADRYVARLAELNTEVATALGTHPGDDRVPDLSPDGQSALDDLARAALTALPGARIVDDDDRRCARLLRERLEAGLAMSAAGEHLRAVRNITGPHQRVRQLFQLMPTATPDDWATVARRMARVPQAFDGWHGALARGRPARAARGAPPARDRRRPARRVARHPVVARVRRRSAISAHRRLPLAPTCTAPRTPPPRRRRRCATGSSASTCPRRTARRTGSARSATGSGRGWPPAPTSTCARPTRGAGRSCGGSTQELRAEADRVLPGADPLAAMAHLDTHGPAVEGVAEVRGWLQELMDRAVAELDGRHFAIEGPVRRVEAMIAPAGSAAAPYYTRPSLDFTRPGRTWLPTLGATRFPVWNLVSTWYHEGVPGHHLQLARWVQLAGQRSSSTACRSTRRRRLGVGDDGGLGALRRAADGRAGLPDRARRPAGLPRRAADARRAGGDRHRHAPAAAGAGRLAAAPRARRGRRRWRAAFFGAHCGRSAPFLDSEIVRYLGWPGQAISYKLGERAWLAGRDAARAARGPEFDLAAWHAAALSLGALGLSRPGRRAGPACSRPMDAATSGDRLNR